MDFLPQANDGSPSCFKAYYLPANKRFSLNAEWRLCHCSDSVSIHTFFSAYVYFQTRCQEGTGNTVLPGTTQSLNKFFKLKVCHRAVIKACLFVAHGAWILLYCVSGLNSNGYLLILFESHGSTASSHRY